MTLLSTIRGVVTLDGSGKIPSTYLPTAIIGAVVYQGIWNASTNSPSLSSGVGAKGQYYKVSVAGSTSIDGISQWNVGDLIIYNGTTWDKIDGLSSEVTSVAGRTGAVTLTTADINGLSSYVSGLVPVTSVAGRTGAIILTTADIGGLSSYVASNSPVQSVAGRTGAVTLTTADVSGAAPLASPAFTGSPTAPTQSAGDNSTKIATTGYVQSQGYATTGNVTTIVNNNFVNSLATNGYQKLPSGFIIQWGSFVVNVSAGGSFQTTAVTFPIAFPNAAASVVTSAASSALVTTGLNQLVVVNISASGFTQQAADSFESGANEFRYIAIGY